jgi:hypothetical protein
LTRLPLTVHGRTVLLLEVAPGRTSFGWQVANAAGEHLVGYEDAAATEAEAWIAVKRCARELLGQLVEGIP